MSAPKTIYLKDYSPPPFLVDTVDLHIELGEEWTDVESKLQILRNPASSAQTELMLNGHRLGLEWIRLNDTVVPQTALKVTEESLTIRGVPEHFTLATKVRLKPQDNTSLEGLYKSGATFCTQCEAEGFRKITWFPDRPDVMSRYTTTVVADAQRYPVLLSNGNPVERGNLDHGRHWIRWSDPYPKPSYLFALVAGNLVCVEDRFRTRSGRQVVLQIYVEPHNHDRCDHAMASLKHAMAWDEEVYGREYDLDIYMVVAVDDFNMGAMENKGLNVFNSKYVLARADTATDNDYAAIEGVIAHEYFHNWTGNRVTCRDWFQLSLKEGLTVFRDQEFSSDRTSRAVKRIQDVRMLRTHQFAEDAGPMAHPVRPESYIEISNFYTVTIYNKGAEVIRMMHTLLGAQGFRRGMDLYFERHDGQAVTTEDFVKAMEHANKADLTQFRRWYTQAGTPRIQVAGKYDAERREYVLELAQDCPPTPGQPRKAPFHIPLRIALLDPAGKEMAATIADEDLAHEDLAENSGAREWVLSLTEAQQSYRFSDVAVSPVVSIARGFSAPVKVEVPRTEEELILLLGSDRDSFNRWDAAQTYASQLILGIMKNYDPSSSSPVVVPDEFVAALGRMLETPHLDPALVAESLSLPSESNIADQVSRIDVDAIHATRQGVKAALARALEPQLRAAYLRNRSNAAYDFNPEAVGQRTIKNLCLGYLIALETKGSVDMCASQFRDADNMTDALAALAALTSHPCPERDEALAAFERKWEDDALVMDKWFTLQAVSWSPDTLDVVKRLMGHRAFDLRNPNKVRSLIGAFCHGNQVRFHSADGSGYEFLTERVLELDPLNPQIAARLMGSVSRWRRLDGSRQGLVRTALERILATPALSKDTYEIASKTLLG